MKLNTWFALGLFGVGAGGYFLDLNLWGVWLFAGYMVLTHD
ncbi:hypothetical protein XbC2_174 [Xanthomonas phage XbC2]|nr:hypothetical protein XbC2_174 [Xanthomonas phage XbC2]